MITMTEFLLARFADEESLALDAATEGTPHRTGWQLWTMKIDTTPGGERLGPRGSVEASPARVETECAAKRRIVARAQRAEVAFAQTIDPTTSGVSVTMMLVLADLASVYAGHPDYREEW